MGEKIDEEEIDVLVELGLLVFPEADISVHPTKSTRIVHNLKFLEKHDQYTTNSIDVFYHTDWQVFLYDFVGPKLPAHFWKILQGYKEGIIMNDEISPIYYLANQLLNH